MTSQELAIVQGPPGTGKTFTSVVAIQSYVDTMSQGFGPKAPPIVIAAQTNHALDQLLGKCMQHDLNVVRLGGRTEDEEINQQTMFNISQRSKIRGTNKGDTERNDISGQLRSAYEMCFQSNLIRADHFLSEGLISQDQFDSLHNPEWEMKGVDPTDDFFDAMATWLSDHIEQDRTYVYRPPQGQIEPAQEEVQQRSPEDEERERLKGEFLAIKYNGPGSVSATEGRNAACYHRAKKWLSRCSNLYDITAPRRGMVYRYLRQQLLEKVAKERIPKLLERYQEACDKLKVSRWNRNVQILQDKGVRVIGCTTTGLTKYRGLISAMKPRVLMIEEAAETRESNITSALFPSLDQIVLVGDHQQLVPHVDNRELEGHPYHLNKSLFARLVESGIPYSMLKVQRRMIPTIRSVVHTFYPELEDHDSVKDPSNRPPVPGMGGQNLWWFQHQWGDQQNANFSFFNDNEAAMIVGFAKYLVHNGMRPSQITILTYYNGQVGLIREKLRQDSFLTSINPAKTWSVRTVDGFQGEENDVILLSLVRSPASPHDRARVGFVDDENRAVVATSRARRGMYLFGNSNNVLSCPKSKETWQRVYNVFAKENCIGYKLPVVCGNHATVTNIREPCDWDKIQGGCSEPCDEKCAEGHKCRSKCHLKRQNFLCRAPCERGLPCGHGCSSLCGDRCECSKGCNKPAIAAESMALPLRGVSVSPAKAKATKLNRRGSMVTGRGRGKHSANRSPRGRAATGRKGHGFQRPTTPISQRPLTPSFQKPIDALVPQRSTAWQEGDEPTSEQLMEHGFYALVPNGGRAESNQGRVQSDDNRDGNQREDRCDHDWDNNQREAQSDASWSRSQQGAQSDGCRASQFTGDDLLGTWEHDAF